MKRLLYILLISVALQLSCYIGLADAFAAGNGGGAASVVATIDSVQMVVGEQTGLHIAATVKDGQRVSFHPWKAQQLMAPGLEVVEQPRIDTTQSSDGYITVTQHLVLTAWDDTLYTVPKQQVKIDGKVLESKVLALKVLTVDVDTLHPNQFYGPKDVQDNPFLWSEWSQLLWL